MAWKWFDSHIIRMEDVSTNTKRFWIQIDGGETLNFEAGQFVTMDLPIGEKRNQRWRSYSIASAPGETNTLEFCIVFLEHGLASKYFFEEASIGTPIRFKGPAGNFVLPSNLEKDLVLICTGTGVAPYRSMLWDIYNNRKPHKKIHLIFGTRYADGILYRQEFEKLAEEMPDFRYSVALSREQKVESLQTGFELAQGYVHKIYLHHYVNPRPDILFYLCGWSTMIDDAVANLIVKLGYDKSQVKYELYG